MRQIDRNPPQPWKLFFVVVFVWCHNQCQLLLLNYDHFAPWSFRPLSSRPKQKSLRPIIEVTSLHTRVTSLHIQKLLRSMIVCLPNWWWIRPIYKYDLDDMFVLLVSFALISWTKRSTFKHRRTSRGGRGGGCSPPNCGNYIIFRAKRSWLFGQRHLERRHYKITLLAWFPKVVNKVSS